MVTTKLNLSMTEPQVRQIYAKQGDTGRVLDISLDQTPEDGTLRILRPDGVEVASEAVTGGEVSESGETVTFDSLTEADVTELTVGIEPVQDLNGYDKPWVGGAGKNLVDNSTLVKGYYTDAGTFAPSESGDFYTTPLIPVQSGATYTASFYSGGLRIAGLVMTQWDANGNVIRQDTSTSVTMASNTTHVRLRNFASQGSVMQSEGTSARWQLELGSSFTSWQPYSNICPITGHDEVTVTRTGKNLLETNDVTVQGGTFVADNDGWISAVNTTSDPRIWEYASSQWYLTLKQGTYAFKVEADDTWASQANRGVQIFTEQNNQLLSIGTAGDYTFTLPKQTTIGVMTKIYAGKVRLQIELGSTATAYEPYRSNTYTTSLGQTVYGGTLDLVSGVLTVDKAMVDLGSLSWNENGAISGGKQYATVISDKKVGETNFICSAFATSCPITTLGYICGRATTKTVAANSPLTTLADFVASVTGQTIVYELETPQTYTLTAQQIKTLVGTNNVWASSGDIVSIKFSYGGLLSELPSEATEIVGKCYCDVEQNGVSSMPFTLNVKKNERAT